MEGQPLAQNEKIHESTKKRLNVVLTKQEGDQLEKILQDTNCENVTQLIKKIIRGELVVY
jgi:hypothetical protein